ncbi:hypothetical protein OAL50_03395, partial [Akkermansiaceae bacterium]|nr:hypothetical protein [Akkermansiaceae bacterium]
FEHLPRFSQLTKNQKDVIIQPQEFDLKGWALMWDMDYLRIENREGFDALEVGEKALLVELIPNYSETAQFYAV